MIVLVISQQQYSVITMIRCVLISITLALALASCASQCGSCQIDSNPYTCTACQSSPNLIYLSSCPTQSQDSQYFIAVVVMVTVLYTFMLAMGIGIYRQLFENIQLISLITWRYGFQGGTFSLQATNLAMVRNNSFFGIFGYQFLGLFIILLTFWLAQAIVGKGSQHPTAILLRRKRIIFPVRVATFVFNILIFSSLAELSTVSLAPIKAIPLAFAIAGLLSSLAIIVFLAVISNSKKFQVDDPHYYVLVEQMTTKKWFAKNNILISLITRAGIITAFVFLFQVPEIAGIVMVVLQVCYSTYFVIFIRYTKIRYFVIIALNTCLTIALIFTIYIGAVSPIDSSKWSQASLVFIILYSLLIAIFFLASVAEVILRKQAVVKQIKSIYQRFIKCQKAEEKIIITKFDQNSHRQRVTQFHHNLLYKKGVDKPQHIEMTTILT